LLKIARRVYNACKDGPKKYKEISRETKSLLTVLESLKNEAKDPESLLNRRGTGRRQEPPQIVSNCEEAFEEIQALIHKHTA
jgi:Flp pilus assembly CpaE family ATPase